MQCILGRQHACQQVAGACSWFATMPLAWRQDPATPAALASLPLPAQAALAEQGISTPTEIQAAAIPALLRHRGADYILASHTGSGKTLAYLLPIGASWAGGGYGCGRVWVAALQGMDGAAGHGVALGSR